MTGELAENLQNASKDSLAVTNEELKKNMEEGLRDGP